MTIIRLDKNGRIVGQNKGIDLSTPGKLVISGAPIDISPKDAKKIGSGEIGLHVGITYPRSHKEIDIIGEGVKLHKFVGDVDRINCLKSPVYDPTKGNPLAYILMGRMWKAPGILPVIMSLKDDALLAATGMPKDRALAAIGGAMAEWNRCTSGKPFNPQANLTTNANWKLDHVNNMAFTPYVPGCSAIAAAGVWYKTQGIPVGTMYPIVESDMTFNSNMKWTCDPTKEPNKLDFQSVALHELGHTLGLGDIYGRDINDGKQVMGYYTGVRRTLGNGDCTAVWKLYG